MRHARWPDDERALAAARGDAMVTNISYGGGMNLYAASFIQAIGGWEDPRAVDRLTPDRESGWLMQGERPKVEGSQPCAGAPDK